MKKVFDSMDHIAIILLHLERPLEWYDEKTLRLITNKGDGIETLFVYLGHGMYARAFRNLEKDNCEPSNGETIENFYDLDNANIQIMSRRDVAEYIGKEVYKNHLLGFETEIHNKDLICVMSKNFISNYEE